MTILDEIARGFNIDPVGNFGRTRLQVQQLGQQQQNARVANELRRAQAERIFAQIDDAEKAKQASDELARLFVADIQASPDRKKFQRLEDMLSSNSRALRGAGLKLAYEEFGPDPVAKFVDFVEHPQYGTGRFAMTERGNFLPAGKTPEKSPLVEVTSPIEKAEAQARGKSLVAKFETIDEAAAAAGDSLQQLTLLEMIPAQTSPAAGAKLFFTQLGAAAGLDIPEATINAVADIGSYRSLGRKLVLTEMQAQKGPQTEADQKLIASTIASIDNIPAVNGAIIATQKAIASRKVEQAEFWRQYEAENETFRGAASAWLKFKRETPMVRKLNNGRLQFVNEFVENSGLPREQALAAWRLLD